MSRFDDIQARHAAATPGRPWKVTGPWGHDTGYPRTWAVVNGNRTLCDAPTEEGAHLIADALNADDIGWLLDRVTQLEVVAAEAQRYLALDPHVSGKRLAEALAELDRGQP